MTKLTDVLRYDLLTEYSTGRKTGERDDISAPATMTLLVLKRAMKTAMSGRMIIIMAPLIE
jgi:hypothetical protein